MVIPGNRSTALRLVTGAAIVALALSACSKSSSSTSSASGSGSNTCKAPAGTIDKSLSGTTVNFLMPPWGDMGAAEFQKFTDRTGIKVNLQTLPFDQVHDKTVAAMAAKTPPADLMEVDSLWVGQYAAAGWLAPVSQYVAPQTQSTAQAKAVFTINNKLEGMPWVVDYRWTVANMSLLNKAGITTQPQSWNDIKTDAEMLKSKGILKYPVTMPLDITAEATEQWLTLLVSAGGTILDASGKPAFNAPGSPGYLAADFLHSLYAAGLVDPASVNLTGKQSIEQFAAGTAAFDLRSGPGILSFETDPKTSKVANDNVVGFLAGPTGTGAGVFGLPESLGIPANATHKCQAAMLLAWWNEIPNEVFRYTMPAGSSFPAQSAAIDQVLASGKPATAEQIKAVLPNIKPLFLAGAPTWYPEFANDVATVMQKITTGATSVQSGLDSLAKQTEALIAKG